MFVALRCDVTPLIDPGSKFLCPRFEDGHNLKHPIWPIFGGSEMLG